jgi:hypothetical protein
MNGTPNPDWVTWLARAECEDEISWPPPAPSVPDRGWQRLGAKSVILRICGESYSTGMTPEEAIWLARQLTESAKRVRRAAAASPPA